MVRERHIIGFYPESASRTYDFDLGTFVGVKRPSALVTVTGQDVCAEVAEAFTAGRKLTVKAFGVEAEGYVTSYKHHTPVDGVPSVEFNFRVSGAPKMYEPEPHVNCRCTPAAKEMRKMLKKVRHKYYVASPNVTTEREQNERKGGETMAVRPNSHGLWTRKDINEAVAHATEMLEQDPSLEHVAVVKIVRVVRRKKLPVTVEVIN